MQRRPGKILQGTRMPLKKFITILNKSSFVLIAFESVQLNQTNISSAFCLIDFLTPSSYHYRLVKGRSPFKTSVAHNSISSHLDGTQCLLKIELIGAVLLFVVDLV